jgi:hypothetical protein
MGDEQYCSFILDCLHHEQYDMSLRQLQAMWDRAASSSLTVEEFINDERN